MFITFLLFFSQTEALDLRTQSNQKQIIENDINSKFYNLTVDKVGCEKLLARNLVSCKINHLLISSVIPKQAQLNP